MSRQDQTFIGEVASVTGGLISVRLRADMPSTLLLVEGQSYRIGQIGGFLRIPLGYNQLYAVCTQVGADAAPKHLVEETSSSNRWMSISLFGESVGMKFERGVSQYPTIGDEIHLVTAKDLAIIYSATRGNGTISVGTIAASSGIQARLDVGKMVARHTAIVGSTGSGKSNTVAVILEAIANQGFDKSRVLVIDPHGEYASSVEPYGKVFSVAGKPNAESLSIPYWALPFDELQELTFGAVQPTTESAIRDEVKRLKCEAARYLNNAPPQEMITADSPIPFSIKRLWFELEDWERRTFSVSNSDQQNQANLSPVSARGNVDSLIPNRYPPATSVNTAPYPNRKARNIRRNLELMRSRIVNSQLSFLFEPVGGLAPDCEGKVGNDIDSLVASWVGHEKPITVLDVSGLPADILSTIVGTLLRIVYDVLFWAGNLPVSGRSQPLFVVLEEAHIFLPEGKESSAQRTVAKIAKEGRKYGIGLLIVTQRPSEIEGTALSQCGTMISLRLTNSADRTKVQAAMPDVLESLTGLLPSLRTGEGLVVGEAMPIPSRIRFFKAKNKPIGDDPLLPDAWLGSERPHIHNYTTAIANWRNQSTSTES